MSCCSANTIGHKACCVSATQDGESTSVSFKFSMNLTKLLAKASAVALAAFAFTVSPVNFLVAFALGAAVGIYNHAKGVQSSPCPVDRPLCAQAYLEQVTGVKLPVILGLATGFAWSWDHLAHHGTVSATITGLICGVWAGQSAADVGSLLWRKFSQA